MQKTLSSLCLLFVSLFIMTGCFGGDDRLLSTVPSTTPMVAVVNVEKLASALDVKISSDKVELPQTLAAAIPRFDERAGALIANLLQAIDGTSLVVFGEGAGMPGGVTFRITDAGRFGQLLADAQPVSEAGYAMANLDGAYKLVWKKKQGWLVKSGVSTDDIDELLKAASDSPFTSLTGVSEALATTDKPVALAAGLSTIGGEWNNRWAAGYVAIDKKKMSLHVNLIEADGKPVDIPGLQTLSTDFLRYTPSNVNFAMAVGATPDTDWAALETALTTIPSPQLRGMAETVLPYLKKADGTVALAANFDADDPTASGSTFLLMIHMPQASADAALADIDSQMRRSGVVPSRDADGVISLTYGNTGLYAGVVDGYLAVSSMPFSPARSNELNTYFLSHKAAAVLAMPAVPLLDVNMGVTVSLAVESSAVTFNIATTAPVGELLASILEMAI